MHWLFSVVRVSHPALQPWGKGATDWQHDNIVWALPNLSSSDNRLVISNFPPVWSPLYIRYTQWQRWSWGWSLWLKPDILKPCGSFGCHGLTKLLLYWHCSGHSVFIITGWCNRVVWWARIRLRCLCLLGTPPLLLVHFSSASCSGLRFTVAAFYLISPGLWKKSLQN